MTLYLAFVLLPLLVVTQTLHDKALPDPQHYRELLGKVVVLEGVAWESLPGWSGRVQMPAGEQVFIQKSNSEKGPKPFFFRQGQYEGRLVRLVGVLTFSMGRIPQGKFTPVAGITIAQPAYLPHYFSIQLESIEVIDKVRLGRPVLLFK